MTAPSTKDTHPQAAPATEDLLMLGGPHHGTTRTFPASTDTWLDIPTATRYRRGHIQITQPHPATGHPEGWRRHLMVHETIPDPQIGPALAALLAAEFARGGEPMALTVVAPPRVP